MKKCPEGEIRRKAYTRKSGTRVKSSCIKDRGNKGKGPKLFTLKKGGLSKYGYHLSDTRPSRQKGLKKAVKHVNRNTIIRKLNVLSILFKNTNPLYSRRAIEDMNHVRKITA